MSLGGLFHGCGCASIANSALVNAVTLPRCCEVLVAQTKRFAIRNLILTQDCPIVFACHNEASFKTAMAMKHASKRVFDHIQKRSMGIHKGFHLTECFAKSNVIELEMRCSGSKSKTLSAPDLLIVLSGLFHYQDSCACGTDYSCPEKDIAKHRIQ